jgi:hypothetical protein
MRKFLIIFFTLVFNIFSQTLQPPVTAKIYSDFGPRNLRGAYDWHEGIDYLIGAGNVVHAVEGGDIVSINYQPYSPGRTSGGWYIRVRGDLATWAYLHTFADDPDNNPVINNQYEARMARLEDPIGQNPPEYNYIFIIWNNRNNNRADTVLNVRGGWYVRAREEDPGYDPENPYILNAQGERILSRANVDDRETVAVSGNSGNVEAHLDIRCSSLDRPVNAYDINPLYHIIHTNPNYTLNIIEPAANDLFYHHTGATEAEQLNERVRVNINSTTGKDLDIGYVYFFDPDESRTYDDAHLYAKIIYGGLPPDVSPSEPFPSRIINDGEAYGEINRGSVTRTGINPIGTVCGNDDFYFIGGFSENNFQFNSKINQAGTEDALINRNAKFKDGYKDMIIRAHSIRDSIFPVNPVGRRILFDNYVPFVDEVTVKKDEETKYNGKWELNGSEMELDIPTDDSVSIGDKIKLTISFSEVMSSTINVKIKKETNEVKVDGSWNEGNLIWEGNVTIPDEEESKGEWTIMTPHTANGLRLTAKV